MTGGRVPLREIARLAGPALPVLAAEPLYLLIDTAVVGRLGAVPLAGLAVAAVVFAQVTSQLNFLSYGTQPPDDCRVDQQVERFRGQHGQRGSGQARDLTQRHAARAAGHGVRGRRQT